MYRADNGINEGSCWIVELIRSHYTNISTYRPLSGSSYVELPVELRSSIKGLINIKYNDQKCFLWCHAMHINQDKIYLERITRKDRVLANNIDYGGIKFPVDKEDFSKIETKKKYLH